MRQTPVMLPQSFEAALGYNGGMRWVAFYWEPCGDEAMYDDGCSAGDCQWWGFLKFVNHRRVKPWLADYNLGSSDFEAEHSLLCDLETREVYIGERGEVGEFLREEARSDLPVAEVEVPPEVQAEILRKVLESFRALPLPSMAEIEEHMKKEQEAVERMITELEGAHANR